MRMLALVTVAVAASVITAGSIPAQQVRSSAHDGSSIESIDS